jgi:hypothetical protein
MLYVVTLSDTFPPKRVAFTYLHTAVFENVLCEEPDVIYFTVRRNTGQSWGGRETEREGWREGRKSRSDEDTTEISHV